MTNDRGPFVFTQLLVAIIATALTPSMVIAELPAYSSPLIYARSGVTAFNLPNGSSFNSATAMPNDLRQVALDVNFVATTGNPGLFFGEYNQAMPNGGIVAHASDIITGDPYVNNLGQAIFTVGLDDDPFVYDASTHATAAINYPLGISGSDRLVLTDNQRIGGRLDVGFSGDVYGVFGLQSAGLPTLDLYAADAGVDASSPYSFLYSPDTSLTGGPGGAPRIAAKVSTTSGFDFEQIRLFDSGGQTALIAVETESDPSSIFSEFITNSVSVSDNGQFVVFQANDLNGVSGIYRYDDAFGTTQRIGYVGDGIVTTIDIFAPDVNDNGLVVFRGEDSAGHSSVFVGDGLATIRAFGEGDQIITDIGLRRIGRRDGQSNQGGALRVNNRGDVSFSFQYFDETNSQSVADGGLVLLLTAGLAGDFDANGVLECDDVDALVVEIVGGTNGASFDLTNDGLVNQSDLQAWLTIAGAANLVSGNSYLSGDANLDGTVDGSDFIIWNEHKFSSVPAWCAGDFNADGSVDGSDFILWNMFKFQNADGADEVVPVPEPIGLWVCLLGMLPSLLHRGRAQFV